MKTWAIFIVLLSLFSSGCKSAEKKAERSKRMANDTWVNPTIHVIDHPGIIGINSGQDEPGMSGDLKGALMAFCQRINEKFSESGLRSAEAGTLYTRLFQSGILKNEAVGMPDPDNPVPAESIEDFKGRVALKVNPSGGYFIFYRKSGCGFTYFYGTFLIEGESGAINIQPLEVWRASVPC